MRYTNHPESKLNVHTLARGKKTAVAAALCVLVVGFFSSCMPPVGAPALALGSLTVSIAAEQPRTLVPSIDMNAAAYVITGSGPSGASFSTTITTGSATTITALTLGAWTITVDGRNAAGTFITHGSSPAQVSSGSAAAVNVTVLPIAGPGSLSLALSWPVAEVATPVIQAQLVPVTGSAIPLAFSAPSNGSASFSGSGITNGYYTLVIQLMDSSSLVMGAVDLVRIVAGQTTTGSYTFSAVNGARGSVSVNITPNLQNPIVVTMGGQQAEVGTGSPVALTATAPAGTGNVTCAWYVNGVAKTTGASYTVNTAASPLAPGTWRVDVVMFTSDGTRAGSATTNIKVDAIVSANLAWNANTETNLAGYKLYMGTASGVYGTPTTLGMVTATAVPGLLSGHTYYFALTAFNAAGQESTKCSQITWVAP